MARDANKAQPERRDLRIVLTETEARARTAKKALEAGQSFATVVDKFSIDTITKKDGGKLANVAKGQLERALESAAFKAKLGAIVGPIKAETGFYVLRVDKITPAELDPVKDVEEAPRP